MYFQLKIVFVGFQGGSGWNHEIFLLKWPLFLEEIHLFFWGSDSLRFFVASENFRPVENSWHPALRPKFYNNFGGKMLEG